jgi:hypothetical protein
MDNQRTEGLTEFFVKNIIVVDLVLVIVVLSLTIMYILGIPVPNELSSFAMLMTGMYFNFKTMYVLVNKFTKSE